MHCHIYGIPNCDTMKKARAWLADHGIEAVFHNYKKEGVSEETLNAWCAQLGWETLLNRRGMTWRKLPESEREVMSESMAIAQMAAHPSLIKRPVLDVAGRLYAGFSAESYAHIFSP